MAGALIFSNIKWKVLIAYFLIYVVWGSTYYFIGISLQSLSPMILGMLRFCTAGAILLGISLIKRDRKIFEVKFIRHSAVLGIILLFVDMAVIMLAQRYLSSSLVAIFASSTAIWIIILDRPKWNENLDRPLLMFGLLFGLLGVAMLFYEQAAQSGSGSGGIFGVLLMIIGCVSWAGGSLYAKYHSTKNKSDDKLAGTAWQMIAAGISFGICAMVNGDFSSFSIQNLSPQVSFSLIYLIIFGSVLAYSAYIYLLRIRPAAEVGSHALINPVVAVLLGSTLGAEQISLIQFVGLSIILLSVFLITTKSAKSKS